MESDGTNFWVLALEIVILLGVCPSLVIAWLDRYTTRQVHWLPPPNLDAGGIGAVRPLVAALRGDHHGSDPNLEFKTRIGSHAARSRSP